MDSHFRSNLIFLCSYLPSISEVCRRININRAQFNKYVSGAVRPSRHNLRKICDFFGVEEYELLLPPDQLKKLIQLRPNSIADLQGRVAEPMASLERLLSASSQSELKKYIGYYYEYYNSISEPGKILKALVHVEQQDGRTFYTRHERLQPVDSRRRGARFHYRGHSLFLKDKIFMTDYESLTLSEICHTVLYTNHLTVIDYLEGLRIGVGVGQNNGPATSPVVWEFLGRHASGFRLLRAIGLLDSDDPSMDPWISGKLAPPVAV